MYEGDEARTDKAVPPERTQPEQPLQIQMVQTVEESLTPSTTHRNSMIRNNDKEYTGPIDLDDSIIDTVYESSVVDVEEEEEEELAFVPVLPTDDNSEVKAAAARVVKPTDHLPDDDHNDNPLVAASNNNSIKEEKPTKVLRSKDRAADPALLFSVIEITTPSPKNNKRKSKRPSSSSSSPANSEHTEETQALSSSMSSSSSSLQNDDDNDNASIISDLSISPWLLALEDRFDLPTLDKEPELLEYSLQNGHSSKKYWSPELVQQSQQLLLHKNSQTTTKQPPHDSAAVLTSKFNVNSQQEHCIVLLMDPKSRLFELVTLSYEFESSTVADLLQQIPSAASDVRLAKRTYTGLLSLMPSSGKASSKKKKVSTKVQDMINDHNHSNKKPLVAIPQHYSEQQVQRLAESLLSRTELQVLLQKLQTQNHPERMIPTEIVVS